MQNRRAFVNAAARMAAGAVLFGGMPMSAMLQNSASRRREVRIGNRRIKVIDIHAHFIATEELDLVRNTNLAGNISGQPRTLLLDDDRLRTMDERGIDVQVLSHQGAWWYRTDRGLAERLVKVQNERLAASCRAHPDRFVGLASVALQFPDLAAQQLEDAIKVLGFHGVGIGGHVGGEVPSTSRFDSFWAKVQELNVPVFV